MYELIKSIGHLVSGQVFDTFGGHVRAILVDDEPISFDNAEYFKPI